eukprot:g21706.t1
MSLSNAKFLHTKLQLLVAAPPPTAGGHRAGAADVPISTLSASTKTFALRRDKRMNMHEITHNETPVLSSGLNLAQNETSSCAFRPNWTPGPSRGTRQPSGSYYRTSSDPSPVPAAVSLSAPSRASQRNPKTLISQGDL